MRILFCGGGTGGHVSPALAIAEAAVTKREIREIAFVGRVGGAENKAITDKKYKLYEIEISGLLRKFSFENLKRIAKISKALKQSQKILEDFKPDAVIGTGGYVTWPVIKAAQKMKIQTFIHESNAYPGLVCRLLSKKCDKVFLNMPEAARLLKRHDNVKTVGNPINSRFYTSDRRRARAILGIKKDELLICSYAGSGGAEKINEVVFDFIKEYSSKESKIKHIHASGKKYYESFSQRAKDFCSEKNGVYIKPYIDELYIALSASDVVIARCGAMTLTELAASGACAILIPSPNVTGNHQFANAKALAEKHSAKIIEEKDLTSETLVCEVDNLLKNPDERKSLSANIKKSFKPYAEEEILNEILKSAKQ